MLDHVKRYLLLSFCVLVLAACGRDGPEKTAMEWMDSIAGGDFERAYELSSPSASALISVMEMAAMEMSGPERQEAFSEFSDYRHVSTRTDGDRAEVIMVINGDEETIDMVRLNNEWRVDINKEDVEK